MHWRARYFAIIGSLLPLILPKLSGDTPLPPPEVVRVASRNFNVGAESDPQTNETTVYRQNRGPEGGIARGESLWTFPRWFRVFQVSNDGNTIVAETDYLKADPRLKRSRRSCKQLKLLRIFQQLDYAFEQASRAAAIDAAMIEA